MGIFLIQLPPGFIHKIWEGSIAEHMNSKFLRLYNIYGAAGVMNKFFTDLSDGNQKILENYVINEWNR